MTVLIRTVHDGDFGVMLLNNFFHHRKTEPGTGGLGRDVGLKSPRQDIR